MYQDTSHAQIFFGGKSHCAPPATKFLDKEAAQGAHVTFQCLLSRAQGHSLSLYASEPVAGSFLEKTLTRLPLATKFLDEEAAQGARATFECLLWNADHNCSSPYA